MTYEWITPKTDWTYRDKFTYTDYNRIRNNILYINEKINELFPELYMELDLGEPKTSYYDEYFPSEFNAFEDALISFERTGVNYNLGERYYHYDNDPFVWEDVLNRLETCLLRWKKVDKVTVQNISLRPHGDEHTLMFIGDSALFDVVIEPSNATNKNSWTLDNDGDMYVSKYLTCEKISDTQVRVTYTKGRGENAYNNGSEDAQKMFMVEDKNSLTETSGYNCSESIYTNYIRVKVENQKAKCPCHYLAQGSYINRKENNGKNTRQYYKFKKIADNVDGRDITTLQMTLTDLYSPAVFGGNIWDANEIWRKAIEGISFWAFSKDLRDVMQSVRKEVMSNAISKSNYSSRFHLPSFYEYGSQNANVLNLGSPYPYLANNEIIYNGNSFGLIHDNYANCSQVATRSWYVEDKTLNSNGTPHGNGTQKGVLSSRNSYLEKFNPPRATGIFPLIFIPSDLKVVAYMNCYKIDWSGESSLKLSDIPLGAIIFDADGNKGDYSPYVHAQSITLSKTSISMKETAVQTLDISSILPQDNTYGTYLNIYTDIPDCISLNYTTDGGMRKITVTGLKKGVGHIYVELDQFPNEPVIAICNINISEPSIQSATITPASGWTSVIGEKLSFAVTVTPSGLTYTVEWSSSDTSVLTIDNTGEATMVGNGTVTVTATIKQEGNNDIVLTSSGEVSASSFTDYYMPYLTSADILTCVAPSYDKENSPLVLHVAGGYTSYPVRYMNQHYYFSDETNRWTKSKDLPYGTRTGILHYSDDEGNDNVPMILVGGTIPTTGTNFKACANYYTLSKNASNRPLWTKKSDWGVTLGNPLTSAISLVFNSNKYMYIFEGQKNSSYTLGEDVDNTYRAPYGNTPCTKINVGQYFRLACVVKFNNDVLFITRYSTLSVNYENALFKINFDSDGYVTSINKVCDIEHDEGYTTSNIVVCRGNLYVFQYSSNFQKFVYYKYKPSDNSFEKVDEISNYAFIRAINYNNFIYCIATLNTTGHLLKLLKY